MLSAQSAHTQLVIRYIDSKWRQRRKQQSQSQFPSETLSQLLHERTQPKWHADASNCNLQLVRSTWAPTCPSVFRMCAVAHMPRATANLSDRDSGKCTSFAHHLLRQCWRPRLRADCSWVRCDFVANVGGWGCSVERIVACIVSYLFHLFYCECQAGWLIIRAT